MSGKRNGHKQPAIDITPMDPPVENGMPLLDLNTAEQLILQAKQRRAKTCQDEINAILAKHHCGLVSRPAGQEGNTILFRTVVVALDITNKPNDPTKV